MANKMINSNSKPEPIDYFTLLGYIKELDIRVYSPNQVECSFGHSEILGTGSSMIVYRGNLIEDPDHTNFARIPVAVKVPNVKIKDMERDAKVFKVLADVRQELRMMKHFELHPNIISIYGVIFQDLKPVIIVELAEDCITEYLSKKKEERAPVDWETKARFCCEVADGLEALHVAKIVHGDVKGDNILLFKDNERKLVAKIIDFGYSATEVSIERGGKTGGSLHFLAPECTCCAPTDMKAYDNKPFKDKYTFGLFVWQVAKDGEIPYSEIDDDVIQFLKNTDTDLDTLMKELEEDTPQHFKDVIAAMTKYAPEEREDFTKVREMMKVDDMNETSYATAKSNLELYAKELPRDIAKADLSSIEFMSIPYPLKIKIYRNYEKATRKGDANAMFMLAICYSTGFGVEMDKAKALEWCIKAAEAGSLNAIFNIAENYKIKELPVEPSVAFPWYLRAAEEGYYKIANQIYHCYQEGYGVEKDFKKALDWIDIWDQNETIGSMSKVDMNIDETSLHRAARLGNVEDVKFLLGQNDIDIGAKNKNGETALHIAAQNGHAEVVKLLMSLFEADTKTKTKYSKTLLKLAAGRGHVEVVRLFADETSIKILDLSSSELGNSEICSLGDSLNAYTALARLDLKFNKCGDEGIRALAESLKQNTTITQLDLSYNKIGNGGVYALAECLKKNSTLILLTLRYNKIGDDGVGTLAECLKENSTLTKLVLACKLGATNNISKDGTCALADCLMQNSTITQLDLSYNDIDKEGARALGECLKQNSTLIQLVLEGNEIGKEGPCALLEGLKQNSTLTQLVLDQNEFSDEIRLQLNLNQKRSKAYASTQHSGKKKLSK